MKRIIITFLILLFIPATSLSAEVTSLSHGFQPERRLWFGWNLSKDFETNMTDPGNLATANYLYGAGVNKILESIMDDSIWRRTLELMLDTPFPMILSTYLHEYGGHRWVVLENGGKIVKMEVHFIDGGIKAIFDDYDARISSRVAAAGISRQNLAVEYNISEVIGREFNLSDHVWILRNQLLVTYYLDKADSSYSGYKEYGSDIELWIRNTADSEKLNSDVKKGTVWQGLGLIQPLWYTARYWWTGEKDLIPTWYLTPQAELTDAGVMFNLNIYKSFENGLFLKSRIGYGKDRIESDDMYALEVELSSIPLFWDLHCGVRAGFSDTLDTNYNLGASLTRDFGQVSVGVDGNYYSEGYHRESPRAYGSYSEITFWLAYSF